MEEFILDIGDKENLKIVMSAQSNIARDEDRLNETFFIYVF